MTALLRGDEDRSAALDVTIFLLKQAAIVLVCCVIVLGICLFLRSGMR